MEGVVNIRDLMDHLQRNDLVIAPAKMVKKDVAALRRNALKKRLLTLSDITSAELWGVIGRKRVYQLVRENSNDDGVINVDGEYKVTRSCVERIARERGINLELE